MSEPAAAPTTSLIQQRLALASAGYYGFLLRGVLTETCAFEDQYGRDAGIQ